MKFIPRSILQLGIRGLGIGTILFGVAPIIAPRRFAQLFGLPSQGAAASVAIRSVGVRDAVIGAGLLLTINDAKNNGYWLLARGASDGGDAVSCAIALRRDRRNLRLWLLAGVAAAAAGVDLSLYLLWQNKV